MKSRLTPLAVVTCQNGARCAGVSNPNSSAYQSAEERASRAARIVWFSWIDIGSILPPCPENERTAPSDARSTRSVVRGRCTQLRDDRPGVEPNLLAGDEFVVEVE